MRRKEIELTGATLGIFEFGGTGRAMARCGVAFGMAVRALDRDQVAPSPEVSSIVGPEGFDAPLAAADVLAICCPLIE